MSARSRWTRCGPAWRIWRTCAAPRRAWPASAACSPGAGHGPPSSTTGFFGMLGPFLVWTPLAGTTRPMRRRTSRSARWSPASPRDHFLDGLLAELAREGRDGPPPLRRAGRHLGRAQAAMAQTMDQAHAVVADTTERACSVVAETIERAQAAMAAMARGGEKSAGGSASLPSAGPPRRPRLPPARNSSAPAVRAGAGGRLLQRCAGSGRCDDDGHH